MSRNPSSLVAPAQPGADGRVFERHLGRNAVHKRVMSHDPTPHHEVLNQHCTHRNVPAYDSYRQEARTRGPAMPEGAVGVPKR